MKVALTKEYSRCCPTCGQRVDYSNTYDALYCSRCDQWLEEKCSDPNCVFYQCHLRPDRPSQAGNLDPAETVDSLYPDSAAGMKRDETPAGEPSAVHARLRLEERIVNRIVLTQLFKGTRDDKATDADSDVEAAAGEQSAIDPGLFEKRPLPSCLFRYKREEYKSRLPFVIRESAWRRGALFITSSLHREESMGALVWHMGISGRKEKPSPDQIQRILEDFDMESAQPSSVQSSRVAHFQLRVQN